MARTPPTEAPINPARHPPTEQYLLKGAFKFDFHKIPIGKIDMKLSGENPARHDRRIEQERVLKYAIAMESGDIFPGVLLLNHPNPHDGYEWIVATGMHRLEAAQLANKGYYQKQEFDAYCVIEADNERRETVIRQANSWEGKGTTQAEEIHHIIWLHEHFGKPLSTLCKEWNHKLSTVMTAVNTRKARNRGHKAGWDFGRSKVSQDAILALGSIHLDIVFDKACEAACSIPDFGTAEVKEMVADIKKEREEASQLAVVAKYVTEAERKLALGKATKARPKAAKIYKVMREAKLLNNMLSTISLNQLHVALYEDKASALLIIADLIKHAKQLEVEFERCERMSRPPAPELRKGTPAGEEAHP